MNDGTPITFDGNNLQTENILTALIDHGGIPIKDAKLFALAHANLSALPNVNYSAKLIPIGGKLIADTIPDTDILIDTFKSYFVGVKKNLDIGFANGTRRYIATATDVQVPRPEGLNSADFSVVFSCTSPFGRDILTTTALSATGRTSATYSDSHTFIGSAPVQQPIFNITYSAITGGTAGMINIGNDANGQQITISQNFATGDVIQVNVPEKAVYLNGASIAYEGAFPEFEGGAGSMSYSDSFTTRTFDINVIYYAQWL